MRTLILLSALLPFLATATPILARAGGPIAKSIPKTCTIFNPLPGANGGTANVNGYMPSPAFTTQKLLYSAYFDSFLPQEEQAVECRQQCYGYGDVGECKSSFVGYDIPTPEGYFGTAGGELETACLLFSTYLETNSFVQAPAGQYLNATAASIYCPAS